MAKYYLYISDAKVDMLLASIDPGAKKKISAELEFELGILTATVKVEPGEERPLDQRVARLEAVVRHLRDTTDVTDLDGHGKYIHDRVDAAAVGMYPSQAGISAFCIGHRGLHRSLCLIGSNEHIVGGRGTYPMKNYAFGGSHRMDDVVRKLGRPKDLAAAMHGLVKPDRSNPRRVDENDDDSHPLRGDAAANVLIATQRILSEAGRTEALEIFARRRFDGRASEAAIVEHNRVFPNALIYQHPWRAMLGSPLYVALD